MRSWAVLYTTEVSLNTNNHMEEALKGISGQYEEKSVWYFTWPSILTFEDCSSLIHLTENDHGSIRTNNAQKERLFENNGNTSFIIIKKITLSLIAMQPILPHT